MLKEDAMKRKERNKAVFQDTESWINESETLKAAAAQTTRSQRLFLAKDKIPEPQIKTAGKAEIVVSGKRTLAAAAGYPGKKVCILNFASATNPGGGVQKGSSAQEESICRCSTLYFSLATDEMMKLFYTPHRRANNPLYNDDLIYSPNVYVIKRDTDNPKRLQEHDWYKVNVITCAAPNLRKKPSSRMNPNARTHRPRISDEKLEALLVRRIERIFAAAAADGNEVLILGAFGCGAFKNPPAVVAKAFHQVTDAYRSCFETIEYAVFHTDSEAKNYTAFVKEFRRG